MRALTVSSTVPTTDQGQQVHRPGKQGLHLIEKALHLGQHPAPILRQGDQFVGRGIGQDAQTAADHPEDDHHQQQGQQLPAPAQSALEPAHRRVEQGRHDQRRHEGGEQGQQGRPQLGHQHHRRCCQHQADDQPQPQLPPLLPGQLFSLHNDHSFTVSHRYLQFSIA